MTRRNHRNDEPTVLPSDHAGLIFLPDGHVVMVSPAGMQPDDQVGPALHNMLRAAVLFGDGDESDKLRRAVDDMLDAQIQKPRR